MKKILKMIALLAVSAALATSFSACGNQEATTGAASSTVPAVSSSDSATTNDRDGWTNRY